MRLKSDPSVCYVGQAVNIKERWYTHAKKMLKAEDPGNEKLYRYGIEDFVWCVIEANVPPKDLDSHEHYWIQYFKADSVGLNSKR